MVDVQTMVRTEVTIAGENYLLAQGQDLDDLKRRIEAAVQSAGKFVEFVVVGNRSVSVLVSPGLAIVFTVVTVQFDERDTGDAEEPYGGMFDF